MVQVVEDQSTRELLLDDLLAEVVPPVAQVGLQHQLKFQVLLEVVRHCEVLLLYQVECLDDLHLVLLPVILFFQRHVKLLIIRVQWYQQFVFREKQ